MNCVANDIICDNEYYTQVAWDIGIKTLSYCIIKFSNKDPNYWFVEDLGQINLLNSDNHICCGQAVKSKKLCTQKATLVGVDITGKKYYYCGTHKNQYKFSYQHDEYFKIITEKKIMKCCHKAIKKDNTSLVCGKKSTYFIPKDLSKKLCNLVDCKFSDNDDNLYLCNQHMNQNSKKIEKIFKLVHIKKSNCNMVSGDLLTLGERMYTKFNENPAFFNVNKIKIENQPSLINPVMKSLAMLLFSYSLQCKMTSGSCIKEINFIAPSSKLKVDINTMLSIISQINFGNDTQHNIITNNSNIDNKLINLFNKLFYATVKGTSDVDYKRIFGNNYTNFLAHVAMKVVNKKYDEYTSILDVCSKDDQIMVKKMFTNIHVGTQNQKNKNLKNNSNKKKEQEEELKLEEIEEKFKKKENKLIYDITKALSIKYAIHSLSLKGYTNWIDMIKEHDKQDDLTDALLLCLNNNKSKIQKIKGHV